MALDEVTGAKIWTRPIRVVYPGEDRRYDDLSERRTHQSLIQHFTPEIPAMWSPLAALEFNRSQCASLHEFDGLNQLPP